MNKQQTLFLSFYLDISNKETFMNGSQSYRKAYKETPNSHKHAARLLKRDDIKRAIEVKMAELTKISKEDYVLLLHKEHQNDKNKDSTRLRALELIGKVLGFTQDAQNNDVTIINSLDNLKERMIERRRDTTTSSGLL